MVVRFLSLGVFLLGMVGTSHTLLAHDMWLVVTRTTSVVHPTCEIEVAVGMDFPKSISAIDPNRLDWMATNGETKVEQFELEKIEDQNRTVCRFQIPESGLWIVGCKTQPNLIELEAKKFNDYLLHDGMQHVLAGRLDRDELGNDAVEQYSKYTKTMIAAGDDLTSEQLAMCRQPIGHKLEILLIENPRQKKPGDTLRARVLFDGRPLASANLCWDHPGNGDKFSGQSWTDSNGDVVVPLSTSGIMTLRLVHMTRPLSQSYEWESFWSSFTFRVPDKK